MSERLALDYAWQHPDPTEIRRAGYEGVLRYLSQDSTKNLTLAEAKALHAAGLWIALVWETTANRAGQGVTAGVADVRAAEAQAAALGYPKDCVIFYAVDYDAPAYVVRPYFTAIVQEATHPVGCYGGSNIVEGNLAPYRWQTVAWSGGKVSPEAHLYQRLHATKTVRGAPSGWDEDVILRDLPTWGPNHKTPVVAPPKPARPAPPTRVAVARAALLRDSDLLDQAWMVGPRRGRVRALSIAIRALVKRLPTS